MSAIQVDHDTAASTRKYSPEGILKAGAILTRSGQFTYLKSELDMEGDGTIEVNRTLETLSHPTTLETLRDAPLTMGHPPKGITADNFHKLVVGYVSGEPRIAGDVVLADVIIGDKTTQEELEKGTKELSPGYDFALDKSGNTVGPLRVNHIAMEPFTSPGRFRIVDALVELRQEWSEPRYRGWETLHALRRTSDIREAQG